MLNGKFNIRIEDTDFYLGHLTLYSSDAHATPLFFDNKLKKEQVDKFIADYIYDPTDILFGIVAPSCNLKCKDCIKQLSDNYSNIGKTTPAAIKNVLTVASKLGKTINISFANNEIFSPSLRAYQQELIDVLLQFNIGFHVVHTNGLFMDETYPLTKYLLERSYEVVLGANLTETDIGEHLNVATVIPALQRLLAAGVTNISINALYDLERDLNIILFREFLEFTKVNNIKVKLTTVFKKTPPPQVNRHLDIFLREIPLHVKPVQSKEPSLYALFKGEIPIAPTDGFSNFFICDENTIALMSIDKTYSFNDEHDLLDIIRKAFTDLYLTNETHEECSKCPLYYGCFQANRHMRLCEYERINAETLLTLRCKEAHICNSFLGRSSIGLLNEIINTEYITSNFWKQFRRR
jgi:hypothetical protein